jgi:hypothetical protein
MFARDKRIGPYTYVYLVENARQAGFGFASFLLILTLIDRLVTTKRLSQQGAREVIDHALLSAETHQSTSPYPEMVQAAREAIEMAQAVLEQKFGQPRRDRRG